MTVFWANKPTILFNKDYILELWPRTDMTFEQKLNVITRIVLLLTMLGYLVVRNTSIVIVGILTIAIIYTMYQFRKNKVIKEGFKDSNNSTNNNSNNVATLKQVLQNDFYPTTKKNPMGNVLLTEISDKPNRPAAAPSFNPEVYDEINSAVKKQTQMLNPDIKSTNKQLYGDLYDNWTLDQSMRRFYTTANSRVENDQSAFAKWLYGDLISGKESNIGGQISRVKDNYRYILI